MGNCQAVEAAALVIQHPCGKLERFYWPIPASDVMKSNPGHYVSLIIPLPLPLPLPPHSDSHDARPVRFTRVKLLRPTDTLVLGHAYRLVTTQEVMKVLRAKKHAKMKKKVSELESSDELESNTNSDSDKINADQGIIRSERHRQRSGSTTSLSASRSKSWRPSLHSISESGT